MTDISSHLMAIERELKAASGLICNGTMSEKDLRELQTSLTQIAKQTGWAQEWAYKQIIAAKIARASDSAIQKRFEKTL